jgi:SAM-dependent methyltransferase
MHVGFSDLRQEIRVNTMNEEKHWNNIAPSYEDEIFDVFKSDKTKKLPKLFDKYGNKRQTAIDFGSGVGKAFNYIAPIFKNVIATDISAECLAISKEKTSFKNITFVHADLTDSQVSFPEADFALCCNVIILPEVEKNRKIIQTIYKSLKPGGAAVFVMPSLDSMLFTAWRLIEWYKREGVKPEDIPESELSGFRGSKLDILQGIVQIDKHRTKHYTYSEILVIFNEIGFTDIVIDRLEYSWKTEFASPPQWLKEPYPWDWVVECKR